MSRYIDADEAEKWLRAGCAYAIRELPSIDIVRCKECKWYDNGQNESDSWNYCTRHFGHYIDVNDDDFCSYGERRADGQDIQSATE